MTFGEIKAYLQNLFNDTSSAMGTFVEMTLRRRYAEMQTYTGWNESSTTRTGTVTGSQNYITLPNNFNRLVYLQIATGGIKYFPKFIPSKNLWTNTQKLTSSFLSDIPEYCHIDDDDRLYIYPTPASSSPTYSIKYFRREKALISADFTDKTAGTVAASPGSATIVGTGTSFVATDVGNYIFLPDGYFYEVTGYTSSTVITIGKNYEGNSVSGGSYRLGRIPIFPDEGDSILIYGALIDMWTKREDAGRSQQNFEFFMAGMKKLKEQRQYMNDDSRVFSVNETNIQNPNNYPLNLST